ncbi:ORF6N domain-containing protein [Patescibacteria group bacterium]|nr:ORF6N domain-containing protein [Patescibacteria group bacterium]MBU1702952.1 ORF6N domain-containing protein [Patescibacteria group bacterium]MBU1953960.1 ORF6N domain-containing protein [Patescibacteria group bacterium]
MIPDERIEAGMLFIRGKKVMMDRDLATLYGVETRALNQAVRRNIRRFPDDFMFQLNENKIEIWNSRYGFAQLNNLRSQFVISNRGGRRYLPYVFTEQGIAINRIGFRLDGNREKQ